MTVEHLSPEDATLWCVQAADAPLQLGGLALCDAAALRLEDGAVAIDRLRRHLEVRLAAVPRFRMLLTSAPLGQGLVWVDDPHFDMARHMRLVALPRPGSEEQLGELVSRLLETPLSPDRPPWEFWVVEGVEGDRVALVPRFSHVMGDGMAMLATVLSMFDLEPSAQDDETVVWHPGPGPGYVPLLGGAFLARWRHRGVTLLDAAGALVNPVRVARRTVRWTGAAASIVKPSARTPFTRPVGPRRAFAWVDLPLADLEAVKRAEGVKLNDVVLEVVADAMAGVLPDSGARTRGLRAVVPVSTHGSNPAGEVENRFSMIFVDLPDAGDPLQRVRRVHGETTRRKESLQTSVAATVLTLGGLVPQRLLRTVGPRLLHHQPFVNVVVTNMAGPRHPLYLLGSRVHAMYPFVTVTANIGVTVAVVSYDHSLGVGITVDADTVPDVTALTRSVVRAAEDLVHAASVSHEMHLVRDSSRPVRHEE